MLCEYSESPGMIRVLNWRVGNGWFVSTGTQQVVSSLSGRDIIEFGLKFIEWNSRNEVFETFLFGLDLSLESVLFSCCL